MDQRTTRHLPICTTPTAKHPIGLVGRAAVNRPQTSKRCASRRVGIKNPPPWRKGGPPGTRVGGARFGGSGERANVLGAALTQTRSTLWDWSRTNGDLPVGCAAGTTVVYLTGLRCRAGAIRAHGGPWNR